MMYKPEANQISNTHVAGLGRWLAQVLLESEDRSVQTSFRQFPSTTLRLDKDQIAFRVESPNKNVRGKSRSVIIYSIVYTLESSQEAVKRIKIAVNGSGGILQVPTFHCHINLIISDRRRSELR